MIFEPIINTHKIKYSILKDIIDNGIEYEGNKVNIYINLDSILNSFYREDLMSSLKNLNGYDNVTLCSELMNIAAHYRRFFYTRYNMETYIYFYYMNKKPKYNISVYEDYAKDMIEKKSKKNPRFGYINSLLKDNLKLLSILSIYVPKVYFIISDNLEPALIPYHYINRDKERLHLILTKDEYDFQLLSLPNTYILRLKYDNTSLINRDNLFEYLLRKNKYEPNNHIDGKFYELILPFIPCKNRNLKGIKGMGKVKMTKELDKLLDKGLINENTSFNILANFIEKEYDYEEVRKLFNICNLHYQYKRLSDVQRIELEEFEKDKYENRTIMAINEQYFRYNPVMLIELTEGVSYE